MLVVQRYTSKPRFTLYKYRSGIHFWLYRYTSLPYVNQASIHLKFAIGFEIARKSGRFQNRKRKKGKKRRCGIISDTNYTNVDSV